jgi:hypothetical protein
MDALQNETWCRHPGSGKKIDKLFQTSRRTYVSGWKLLRIIMKHRFFSRQNNIVQRAFGDMMPAYAVSPVFDISVGLHGL